MADFSRNPPRLRKTSTAGFRCVVRSSVVASLLLGFVVCGQGPATDLPKATKDRLNTERWWPTKTTFPFKAFAGESVCRGCHSGEASTQVHTPMAGAAFQLRENVASPRLASG